MTSVVFKEHLVVDGNPDVTIEDTFRCLGEYAGIHSFNFDDEIGDGFVTLDAAVWSDESGDSTWESAAGHLRGTGGGAAQWYWILSADDMPDSFVLNMTKFSARGAIAFLATSLTELYYVSWSSSNCLVGLIDAVGGNVTLCELPKASYTGEAGVMLSVQRGEEGYFVSMWADEQFVVNAYIDSLPAGRKIGFGVYESDTSEYDDLRIAELTEVLPISTMDVGETPLGALQRALGRRHINYFVRWNGELRAWRPKAQSAADNVSVSRTYLHDEQRDRRRLFSHWRQIGAWDTADAYDEDLLAVIGHRFHKDDNPDLMTQSECKTEAARSLVRAKEYAHTLDADIPLNVFVEPEDRVTLRASDWLLTSYGFQLQAGAWPLRGYLREYTYG